MSNSTELVTLAMDPAGGSTYVDLGQLLSFSTPPPDRKVRDTTHRGTLNSVRTKTRGRIDMGEIEVEVFYDGSVTEHIAIMDDAFAAIGTTNPTWQVDLNDTAGSTGTLMTGPGFVRNPSIEIDDDDEQRLTFTIVPTDIWTYAEPTA